MSKFDAEAVCPGCGVPVGQGHRDWCGGTKRDKAPYDDLAILPLYQTPALLAKAIRHPESRKYRFIDDAQCVYRTLPWGFLMGQLGDGSTDLTRVKLKVYEYLVNVETMEFCDFMHVCYPVRTELC